MGNVSGLGTKEWKTVVRALVERVQELECVVEFEEDEADREADDADTVADLRQALDQADLDKDDLRTALGDAQETIRRWEREASPNATLAAYKNGYENGKAEGARASAVRVNEAEAAANRWSERAEAYQAVLQGIVKITTDAEAKRRAEEVLQQHALK